MKSFESGPFEVGQKLLYCPPGTKIQTVTFVSLGPRVGKSLGKVPDTVTLPPKTAVVKDRKGNLVTVNLADLKPVKSD